MFVFTHRFSHGGQPFCTYHAISDAKSGNANSGAAPNFASLRILQLIDRHRTRENQNPSCACASEARHALETTMHTHAIISHHPKKGIEIMNIDIAENNVQINLRSEHCTGGRAWVNTCSLLPTGRSQGRPPGASTKGGRAHKHLESPTDHLRAEQVTTVIDHTFSCDAATDDFFLNKRHRI